MCGIAWINPTRCRRATFNLRSRIQKRERRRAQPRNRLQVEIKLTVLSQAKFGDAIADTASGQKACASMSLTSLRAVRPSASHVFR